MVDRATQQRQAEKQITAQQKLDYDVRRIKHKNPKDAIITICIIIAIVVAVFLLGKL